jgi:hypothetical protein
MGERRRHSAAFKTKVAVAAIMGYRTPFGVRFKHEGEEESAQGVKEP